ncbi:inner membrane transporter RhtA [Actinomadura pelletieri DSM 43383]|uniref:Inner membrane transporter RhtA n=1 Tax=Actinomadura pelletieri DSM 43383 TaxID=1120940 RepID=A0A495QL68_9ACTN|nr:EamA family transporter [Actinomadura pelletieri]RKS73304.1 inner membrane transporter RhtA [Actinomadura pelletieri DSM 43383]
MALAEAPGSFEGASRAAGRLRALSLGSVPPPALILLGIISVQVGAGMAKHLFDRLPPSGVVTIRLLTSAIVLGFLARKALRTVLRDHSRANLAIAAGFGLALALMNFSIYQSFARIPLGVAVTIEFLGPLTVSIVASRRARDALWVVLAGGGVILLARGGTTDLDPVGIAFALLAGACWAAYILLTAATGRRFSGTTGLALASVVGSIAVLPLGVASAGTALVDPWLLLIGLGVGLLSSVIPYSLELEALRRMPARVFGILMSLEPAVAALVGAALLGEILSGRQWIAICCVIVACAGAARSQQDPPEAPEA